MNYLTLEKTKELLSACTRNECRDHSFGNREVWWYNDLGEDVAYAHASKTAEVYVGDDCWTGPEAYELLACGTEGEITRNDTIGPDEYQDGICQPGLTDGGVLSELTILKMIFN